VEIASAKRDGEITRAEALQQKRDDAEAVADLVVLAAETPAPQSASPNDC
jgi:hypothetical protein